MIGPYLLAILLGYFWGAFPTGYIVGRLLKGIDVRQYGSGRTGGANVLRSVGGKAFLITILGDLAKGFIPVIVMKMVLKEEGAAALAGLMTLVGHNWSIFLGWRGGAGVAVTIGALFALQPLVVLSSGLVGLVATFLSRYVSLGSLVFASLMALTLLGLALLGRGPWEYGLYGLLAGGIIILAHRPNIERLLAGKERRLGEPGGRREGGP